MPIVRITKECFFGFDENLPETEIIKQVFEFFLMLVRTGATGFVLERFWNLVIVPLLPK